VRLGTADTWLEARYGKDDPLTDFDDPAPSWDFNEHGESPADELLGEYAPLFNERNQAIVESIAIRCAVDDGFGAVALRKGPREDFAGNLVAKHFSEFDDPNKRIEPSQAAAQVASRARDLWEFGVIPLRAKALKKELLPVADIARELGVCRTFQPMH
jgi:hypothetical protein